MCVQIVRTVLLLNHLLTRSSYVCVYLLQRNYRSYIMFVFTGLVLFTFIFIFSCKRIHEKLRGDGILVSGLLRNCPETLALAAFSFAALSFLGGLCCFNAFLVALNQVGPLCFLLHLLLLNKYK